MGTTRSSHHYQRPDPRSVTNADALASSGPINIPPVGRGNSQRLVSNDIEDDDAKVVGAEWHESFVGSAGPAKSVVTWVNRLLGRGDRWQSGLIPVNQR